MAVKYPSKSMLNMHCFCDNSDEARPLVWKHNNKRLGYIDKNGVKYRDKDGQKLKMARLVWIYFNGEIPEGKRVLHKNKNKLDNRIENLYIKGVT